MSQKQETVPQRIHNRAINNPKSHALHFRPGRNEDFNTLNFSDLWKKVQATAAGFIDLGLQKGDHVALISDNRKEWLFCDIALMGLGIIDVPRGSDSNGEEISYIIEHSDSKTAVLENCTQLKKLLEYNPETKGIDCIILMDWDDQANKLVSNSKILALDELIKKGQSLPALHTQFDSIVEQGTKEDESTIIYTSGTTGKPKGVVLTQYSFVFQLENIYPHIPIETGQIMLSVLPIWHTFERACEYIVLNIGASIAYSRPIGTIMLNDLKEINPQWFISVPRIWESIYESIQRKIKKGSPVKRIMFNSFCWIGETWFEMENLFNNKLPALTPINGNVNKALAIIPLLFLWPLKRLGDVLVFSKLKALLGNSFFAGVSGGGAMPSHVDYFFQAAGIRILEGYGLTETGPVLSVRKYSKSIIRSIGEPLKGIEIKIVDKKNNPLPPGRKGRLLVKTPQIMKGYYKNPEATAEVIKDEWFDTGDLAIETFNNGALKIVGRAKETIVLSGGENIEPTGIETKLLSSPLISNVMVVGQDKRNLGALITTDMDELKKRVANEGLKWLDISELLSSEITRGLINQEIQGIINQKNGFKNFEKIYRFTLLEKEFEAGVEMTQTLKLKRSTINKMYKAEIKTLFN